MRPGFRGTSQHLAEGDVPAKVIYSLGAECGYTPDMLKYAGKKIGALKQRIGGREEARWQWSLRAVELNLNNSSAGKLTVADQAGENTAPASDPTGPAGVAAIENGGAATISGGS